MNAQTPLLYGLPKIHKVDIPIRPVVSYINSPAHKLATFLNEVINSSTNFTSKYSVRNSLELAKNLQTLKIPNNSFLVSFDVKNLFPSVPPQDCLELVRELLFSQTNIPTYHILNICLLIDTVLDQNFFQFNNILYTQDSGLAMGSPLSPLLAEIFMSKIESKIESHPLFEKTLGFSRYVDDTFLVFTGDRNELNEFLDFLNNIHPCIKFTMEIEMNNSIPFLDLNIKKSKDKLEFSIYHKATSTDLVIPYHSNHPQSHKLAAFHSLLHRLFHMPLNQTDFFLELNYIKQIAVNNHYPLSLINKLYFKYVSKSINKNLIPTKINEKEKKYFSLSFYDTVSYRIANIFKKHNIILSYKTTSPLRKFLVNSKDKIPILHRSGVYCLSCNHPGCNTCYIGQSGRRIATRVSEHNKIIEKNINQDINDLNSKSTFANHVVNEHHSFDPVSDTKVLHCCNKGIMLNLLEILEIQKALRNPNLNCINDQVNFSCLPFFNSLKF